MNQQNENKYIRSSTYVKKLHYDNDKNSQPEAVGIEPGTSEEISITLTYEKTLELFDAIKAAVDDPSGDGGVRISMYSRHSVNKTTKEEFDSLSMLIYAKFPNANKYPSKGNKGNNGRREYPKQNYQAGQNSGQQGNATTQKYSGQNQNHTESQAPRGGQTRGGSNGGQREQYKRTSPSNGGDDVPF